MNEEFWKEFYSKKHVKTPSAFAKWLNLSGLSIVDFGCGNGRDTLFLQKLNTVTGVDPFAPKGPMFIQRTVEEYLKTKPIFNVAYCRFFFHAIEENTETALLEYIASLSNTLLCAEFRSDKGTTSGHKRRLINGNDFMIKLMMLGFEVTHYEEGKDLAKFKDENPYIVRIIAIHK